MLPIPGFNCVYFLLSYHFSVVSFKKKSNSPYFFEMLHAYFCVLDTCILCARSHLLVGNKRGIEKEVRLLIVLRTYCGFQHPCFLSWINVGTGNEIWIILCAFRPIQHAVTRVVPGSILSQAVIPVDYIRQMVQQQHGRYGDAGKHRVTENITRSDQENKTQK